MKTSTIVALVLGSLTAYGLLAMLFTPTNSSVFQQMILNLPSFEDTIQSQQQYHRMERTLPVPPTLEELVMASGMSSCRFQDMNNSKGSTANDFILVNSTILNDPQKTHPPGRRIPKLIHVTSKSRCIHKNFVAELQKWQIFPNHSFYFHDDEAVEMLLTHPHFQVHFPNLNYILPCILSATMKSDLWRLLVLWEYGGIYTDIDNAPGPKFVTLANDTIIHDDDDAFFVVERIGYPSQYFMAVSPKHPILFTTLHVTINNILQIQSIKNTYVAKVSGPLALKEGMMIFLGNREHFNCTNIFTKNVKLRQLWAGAEGRYTGIDNRTITVVGRPANTNEWIHRESLPRSAKEEAYVAMGMKHFTWAHKGRGGLKGWPGGRIRPPGEEWDISCQKHLYKRHVSSASPVNVDGKQ